MRESNFLKDKKDGRLGEVITMQTFQSLGYQITDVTAAREYQKKDIDLLADKADQHMEIEVKTDKKLSETGNIVLELETRNTKRSKKGWFLYTEASHLCFVDIYNYIIHCVRTDELRKLCQENAIKTIVTKQMEKGKYYQEGVIGLVPVSLLETLPHYNKIVLNKGE